MKKLLLISVLLLTLFAQAQIVNIPDANFKNALLNYDPVIDTNNDGEIQISEALLITSLQIINRPITDLTGIEEFVNLLELRCVSDLITNLDLSQNINLTELDCRNNQLVSLNVSQNINLTELLCSDNELTTLDVSQNINLQTLVCSVNELTTLDVSQNINLTSLHCSSNQYTEFDISNLLQLVSFGIRSTQISNIDLSNNPELISVFLNNNPNLNYINYKNGNNSNFSDFEVFYNDLPNLEIVCVDNVESDLVNFIISEVGHPVIYSEYCTLEPAQSNQINGNVKLDLDNNGCNASDLPMPNLMLITDNGTETFATFTQNNGDYLLYTNGGDFTTAVTINLPDYFTVNPNAYSNTFTGFDNTFTADFCIEPNQAINDVNISILPIIPARPNFEAKYKLVYKNVGTTVLNGSVALDFDATKLDFSFTTGTISSQTDNNITFSYANLNPFETRTIDVNFNVLSTVNIDDILNFTATVNPISNDYTPNDNVIDYSQTVVSSYDPNDIHILEGPHIRIQDKDDYVHYFIRFQNTGNAEAFNVVVTNKLDANLDWTTMQLESTSHATRVAIHNGNDIEFIFEDINLPDSTNDEPNSHGYIAYKIKLKNNILVGDIIPNQAKIFFDLNEAIDTNIASTEIIDNTVSVNNNSFSNSISIYPNPTNGLLHINAKNVQIVTLKVYSKLGQLILSKAKNDIKQLNLKKLSKGLYFIKLEDKNGNVAIKKIIKE